MSRWYRAYADQHRNPKVAALTDREFRLWHRLLSIAAENDGIIPPVDRLKRVLNLRLDHLLAGVERLISSDLIDRLEVGYEPHNWSKRQYKSDTSTNRVQKHRSKRNVSETPPETDTDTEAEKKPDKSGSPACAGAHEGDRELFELEPPDGGDAPAEQYTTAFETWWATYPNKSGKRKAALEYQQAFKRLGGARAGTERIHATLLHALRAQCSVWRRKGIVGKFIPHPATWLHQSRWEDGAVKAAMADKKPNAPPEGLLVDLAPAEPLPEKPLTLVGRRLAGWNPDEEER